MYTPNDQLRATHQRLLNATSSEVTADAPAQRRSGWEYLVELPPLPNGFSFTPRFLRSPPHDHDECYSINHVNPGSWGIAHSSQLPTSQHLQHRLPTPPARNDGLHRPAARYYHPNFSHVSQEQATLRPNFFPQTRAYLAAGPNIVKKGTTMTWNTDGRGGSQDDLMVLDHEHQSHQDLQPQTWERPPLLERQPQLNHAIAYQSPYAPFLGKKYAPTSEHHSARRASCFPAHPVMIPHRNRQFQMPAVQQWRADNLAGRSSVADVVRNSVHPTPFLAPARGVKRMPNAEIRRKQEVYRQKGDARRHNIAAGMAEVQKLVNRPFPVPGPPKAKSTATAPAKRRKLRPPDNSPSPTSTTPADLFVDSAVDKTIPIPSAQALTPEDEMPTPLPTADDLPQSIVSTWEQYKWSVYHYELQPVSGYDYAESWLHQLFSGALKFDYREHHLTHVSTGFIKDGTPLSLLILHNATNPFPTCSPPITSTITIGVYGYHWYTQSAIHWTTLASDQQLLIEQCVQAGFLVQKHKWPADADKASEKRFHRAYWRAANRQNMKDLLNCGRSDEKSGDLIEDGSEEDPDVGFCVSRKDLTNVWNVTDQEADEAWREVQGVVEGLGSRLDEAWKGWPQHVVVSRSGV